MSIGKIFRKVEMRVGSMTGEQNGLIKLNEGPKLRYKLWNRNFILLMQGQFVSIFGDNIYDTAVRFWILANTGSLALMSVLMAASTLPKIFISPFAGTFIDRNDRKRILIISDTISGITIVVIGLAAVIGVLQAWMVLIAGILVGTCGCFFNPTINSAIPDIVPESKLTKANSILSSISSANDVTGYAFGGILVQVIGAPLLFLFNGFSFLFSAACECFVKIPKLESGGNKTEFIEDLKSGLAFVNNMKGLKYLYITIAFMNFFASMSMTLTLPLFKMNSQLGVIAYGLAMAVNTSGVLVGFIILSAVNIKKEIRFKAFILSGIILSCTMILYSLSLNIYFIYVLFFIDGLCLAVIGLLIQTAMQNSVPSNMRSKVFAFRNTLTSALMPLGMITAGLLSEIIKMNIIILVDYVLFLIIFIFLSFMKSVKEII